jgi:DNA-binding NarL/FixJ family response regulator
MKGQNMSLFPVWNPSGTGSLPLSDRRTVFLSRCLTEVETLTSQNLFQNNNSMYPRNVKTVKLSPRESEILALLAEGLTDKEIVSRLSSSFTTVRTHLTRIYGKMQVRCRTEAAVKYLRCLPAD